MASRWCCCGKPFYGEAIQRLAQTAATLGPPSNARGRVTERTDLLRLISTASSRDYDG